jgi:hypothetical protein
MQTLPSQNLSVLSLGGLGANQPSLIIPEANSQGYFTIYAGGIPGQNLLTPFVKNGTLYQVTAGKTFKAIAVQWVTGTANGSALQLMSKTSTFNDGGAVGAGDVYQCNVTAKYCYYSLSAWVYNNAPCTYEFAAASWPGIQYNTGSSSPVACWVIGKEV